MKHTYIYMAGLALLALPQSINAQEITGFEETAGEENYTAIGVYDSWPESPFRTNQLQGNVQVVDNTMPDEANETTRILAFQRSRFASNLFGARIDLKETFELTTTPKYVHVMVKKDKPGRVMLIGLGKRTERALQSAETEQFWALSGRTVEPGQWEDAVFTVKGNGGIDIHSLVVVPDCESTHDLDEDFAAYIDEIVVNDSPIQRYKRGEYLVNFNEDDVSAKSNYYVNYIRLTSPTAGEQTINVGSTSPLTVYRPMLGKSFLAKAGETVTPEISFSGNWMNGYVYIDYGQDGQFDWQLNEDYTAPENSDIVSYYYIETVENSSGFNYRGEPVSGNARNTMQTPAFTLPADLKPGFYRMRYKVDWGNADAGGRVTASNDIISNGGSIVDIRLNIHGDEVNVTTQYQNGDILAPDGGQLAEKAVFGQPLTIRLKPENGFKPDGITLRHGYNLTGDSLVHGMGQYEDIRIPAYAVQDELLTIPGELVDGDLHILAHFAEVKSGEDELGEYEVNFPKDLTITRTDRRLQSFTLTGNKGCSYTTKTISNEPRTIYVDKTDEIVWVQQEEQITPTLTGYANDWMHTYLYIDYDKNGIFSVEIGDDKLPTATSELVCFSYRDGVNSLGVAKDASNLTAPAFTIPGYLPDGVYRARLKIDWDNDDPKGRYGDTGNNIDSNAGYVIDFLMRVGVNDGTLTLESPNGNIYGANNAALPHTLQGTSSLQAYLHPVADGYELTGNVEITSGDDFTGPEFDRVGNRQWYRATLTPEEATAANGLWIPVFGPVSIKAGFMATEEAEYKLVFSDEFEGEEGARPDNTKWKSSARQNATWNRFISDKPEVAYLSEGNLVLKAMPNPDKSEDNVDMISGAMETKGLFSFKHGIVECRAKVNGHTGNFPAIWMMPQDQTDGWPTCGEIDIFEQIDAENKAYHTVHSHWTYDLGKTNDPQSSFGENAAMDRYHTYGLEWEEGELRWLVDGTQVASYARSTDQSKLDQGQWPFEKEFYLILNQSVGVGSWASAPDLTHTYRMDVDWIRVYQIPTDDETGIKETVDNHRVNIRVSDRTIILDTTAATHVSVSTLAGQILFAGTVDGSRSLSVPQGIYIVNNQKVMVP